MTTTPVRERTRLAIRGEATRLFTENGYEATSLQDIADAVGCSKATVLYHFDGKPAIIREVLAEPILELTELMSVIASKPRKQAQAAAIGGLVDLAVHYRGLVSVLHDIAPKPEDFAELAELNELAEPILRTIAVDDSPLELAVATFALNGLFGICRELDHLSDEELRTALDASLNRLVRPQT